MLLLLSHLLKLSSHQVLAGQGFSLQTLLSHCLLLLLLQLLLLCLLLLGATRKLQPSHESLRWVLHTAIFLWRHVRYRVKNP